MVSHYVREKPDHKAGLGGKLNLFRFFVVRAHKLVKYGGRVGMIVPLSLLADVSCATTRKHLLQSTSGLRLDCFPQKDDKNRRIFKDAKLSTMIFSGENRRALRAEGSTKIAAYPGNSFSDTPRLCTVRYQDAALLDPKNVPLPMVDAYDWDLCTRIHKAPGVVRLNEIEDFATTRGEINQTVYRAYITGNAKDARLVKGVEVARYFVREKLSQGEREWFDQALYLQANRPKAVANVRRIATQRITGVDERYRIVATIIEPRAYFADSTNSIEVLSDSPYRLEYLLAMLNSSLFQWRFKMTSSNNNVGTNELDSLPFRTIDFASTAEVRTFNLICSKVDSLLESHKQRKEHSSERDSELHERRIVRLDSEIDRLVGSLYGLNEVEMEYVAEKVRKRAGSRTF